MKKASIFFSLIILIQISASAQETIRRSWTKYYLGDEKIKKKELKAFLIDSNDEEIVNNIKVSNSFYVGGGIMLGIGVVFMSMDKWNEEVNGNSNIPMAVGSLSLIVLGVGMIINSEIKLKRAVNRYNEIILTPTSNGIGFVYRF